jgi:hypothetical protein
VSSLRGRCNVKKAPVGASLRDQSQLGTEANSSPRESNPIGGKSFLVSAAGSGGRSLSQSREMLACPDHRRAVRVLDGLGHGKGREPKSGAFPHLTGPTVVILMSALAATTGPGGGHHDLMFGVGAAPGVGIGVAIGGCVAALTIGWWDRDADRTVRREGPR